VAVAAASQDTRFESLATEEMGRLNGELEQYATQISRANESLEQWPGSPVCKQKSWEGGVEKHQEVIIDDEIVQFKAIGPEGRWDTFLGCKRGAFGTRPAAHKAGAAGRHYGVDGCINGYIIDQETDLLDEVANQVRQAAAVARNAGTQVRFYLENILPQAKENVEAARRLYQTGEQGILALIEAQETLIQQRLLYQDVIRDHAVAMAELESAVGGRLPSGPTTRARTAMEPAGPPALEP
jgi:hypothetical protein